MRKKFTLITILVYLSTCFNARSQWVRTSNPPNVISSIVTIGTNLFVAAKGGISVGVFFSPDDGATWTKRNGNFPDMEVYTLVTNGSDLFAGTGGNFGCGIYKSSDLGITWVDITPDSMLRFNNLVGLTLDGTNIYACTDYSLDTTRGNGIFKSPVSGASSSSWTKFSAGLPVVIERPLYFLRSLQVHGNNIYAGTHGRGVWVSPTSSPAWAPTAGMTSDGDYISAMFFNGNNGFAGNISGTPILYRSVDNGLNWMQSNTSVFEDKPVYSIISDQTTVYAGTELNGVMKSTDNGFSWTAFNEGFKDSSGNWFCNNINVRALAFKGNTIFAGTDCGVWKRSVTVTPVTPVSVNDPLVTTYPNPASSIFKLKVVPEYIGSNCIIKDATGAIVLQQRITNETTSINVAGLGAGMYFIRVGNQYRRSIKLVKN